MNKSISVVLGVLMLVAFSYAVQQAFDWYKFAKTPFSIAHENILVEIEKGENLVTVANRLEQESLLKSSNKLVWLAKLRGQANTVFPGEYLFSRTMSAHQVINALATGKVITYSITLIEGWTFNQVLAAIQQAPKLVNSFSGLSPEQILQDLKATQPHPEGLFFPDTYHYTKGMTDKQILQRAYQLMQKHVTKLWNTRPQGLPYQSPYEMLTMASIIEKETALAHEQPMVAGVFIRRLQIGMRLQTDPTVIYGLKDKFKGNLTRKHLQQDTLYNTYLHKGLPPTPIAMPGLGALKAALNPDSSKYLYFVAKGDGSHIFSESLEQHQRAVRKYQLNN